MFQLIKTAPVQHARTDCHISRIKHDDKPLSVGQLFIMCLYYFSIILTIFVIVVTLLSLTTTHIYVSPLPSPSINETMTAITNICKSCANDSIVINDEYITNKSTLLSFHRSFIDVCDAYDIYDASQLDKPVLFNAKGRCGAWHDTYDLYSNVNNQSIATVIRYHRWFSYDHLVFYIGSDVIATMKRDFYPFSLAKHYLIYSGYSTNPNRVIYIMESIASGTQWDIINTNTGQYIAESHDISLLFKTTYTFQVLKGIDMSFIVLLNIAKDMDNAAIIPYISYNWIQCIIVLSSVILM